MTSGIVWYQDERGDRLFHTVLRVCQRIQASRDRQLLYQLHSGRNQQGGTRCRSEAAKAVEGPYPRKRSGLSMSVSELERSDMQKPRFDWSINLGHVLTIAAILGSLAAAYTTYQVTISDHDSRIRSLEKQGLLLDSRTNEIYNVLYSIKQDLAIVKYRMEQEERKK